MPRLTIEDIDPVQVEVPIEVEELPCSTLASPEKKHSTSKLVYHILPTNGILYANMLVDITSMNIRCETLLIILSDVNISNAM